MLTDTGYRVVRRAVASRDYPPGIVVAQDPPARTASTAGTVVTIDVANGPPESTTTSMLGLLSDEANAAATARCRAADRRRRGATARVASAGGTRVEQSPVAGTKVDAGTTVTIWVNPPGT